MVPVNILLTGATGFVGGHLVNALLERGEVTVTTVVRRAIRCPLDQVIVPDLSADTDWSDALAGQQVVVHAAARAHVMDDKARDPLAEYRRVNTAATLNLARQAAAAGIRRFLFISSVKVNGEGISPGRCYYADDPPAPADHYAVSKWEAEQGLLQLAEETGMEVVIIRPPLVYGPGVKGNFARMVQLVEKGWPLPLGAVDNRRSLVSVFNLVDLVICCIDHPRAVNQRFLVSDDEDISTSDLLRQLGAAMNRPARLVGVPVGLLRLGATVLGKRAMAQRLLGSLQVDIRKTCDLLGWRPPLTLQQGLRRSLGRNVQGGG